MQRRALPGISPDLIMVSWIHIRTMRGMYDTLVLHNEVIVRQSLLLGVMAGLRVSGLKGSWSRAL
jgi:hypothetical protein